MRVDELRKIVAGYDQEVARRLVVEVYKMIPKKERDDAGLDELIRRFPEAGKITRKPKASADLITDFAELEGVTEELVENAALGYYLSPNRIVPKTARSRWRFAVRKPLKSLIAVKGENSEEAALLLVELYRMLSHACGYYIFHTEAPFSAVGFTQPELLEIVLGKLFANGPTREAVRLAVYIILESHVDRETLHQQLQYPLLCQLKTSDTRLLALEECEFFMTHFKDPLSRPYASEWFTPTYSRENWGIDFSPSVTEHCAELYLRIAIALSEYDKGVRYFKKHRGLSRPEVNLYRLLHVLGEYLDDGPEMVGVWLKAYDAAVARGVEPRSELREWRDSVAGRK
jgi:hypothetical protein